MVLQILPLCAQESNVFRVETLVAEALSSNPELKFYEAEIDIAKSARRVAQAWENPELSASVGRRTVRAGGLNSEGIAWSVSLLQPFEWPGRLSLRKAIANREIQLAELGMERFRIALGGQVRTRAFELFAAQEKEMAARDVAERIRSLREVVVQRDPAGLTPLLETRVIEATELNAQRRASDALLARQRALLDLNRLRGLPPETTIHVASAALAFRPLTNRTWLVALAETNNFELRFRQAELEQQEIRVQLTRNERFPTLALGPTFSEENAGGERERMAGIAVTLPLPIWKRNAGEIGAATSRQVQAEVSLRMFQRELESRIAAAASAYEIKRREMLNWRPDSIRHFQEAAELADRHYRLGAVSVSTYLELQKQYLEAVEGLLETQHEALSAALEIELLTGLTPSLILLGEQR